MRPPCLCSLLQKYRDTEWVIEDAREAFPKFFQVLQQKRHGIYKFIASNESVPRRIDLHHPNFQDPKIFLVIFWRDSTTLHRFKKKLFVDIYEHSLDLFKP